MRQIALAVVLLVVASGRAEAECGIPRWFGVADASTLPSRGSVYLHHEVMGRYGGGDVMPEPSFGWLGAATTLAVTKVSDVVVRIDYDAPHTFGADLAAGPYDDWDNPHVTFDHAWAAPARAPHVVQYWHDVSSWTCSSTDSVKLQLDEPVAAVRMRWTFEGETREWIEVPRSYEPTKTVVELGKFNCGSTTVDPAQLATGGHLELIAIRADRSEIAVTGLPDRLSSNEMPTDDRDRTMHLASMLPATAASFTRDGRLPTIEDQAPAPTAAPANGDAPGRGVGVLVLAIIALGGVLGLLLRGRAPTALP